jgi:hypothetical protein
MQEVYNKTCGTSPFQFITYVNSGTIHGLNDYSNRVSPPDQSPYIPELAPNRAGMNNTPGPIGGTTSLNSVNASAPAFTPRATGGAKEVFQFGKMGGI